jgi:hypothetical protein
MKKKNQILNISLLHLEIIYHLKNDILLNEIKSKGKKVRLTGGLNLEGKKYNLIKILRNKSPLFFNEYSDETIKKSIKDIISNTYKNNRTKTKIYKLSRKNLSKFINSQNLIVK